MLCSTDTMLNSDGVFVLFAQALCILANVADGDSAKDYIMGNEDMLKKLMSYMVSAQVSWFVFKVQYVVLRMHVVLRIHLQRSLLFSDTRVMQIWIGLDSWLCAASAGTRESALFFLVAPLCRWCCS